MWNEGFFLREGWRLKSEVCKKSWFVKWRFVLRMENRFLKYASTFLRFVKVCENGCGMSDLYFSVFRLWKICKKSCLIQRRVYHKRVFVKRWVCEMNILSTVLIGLWKRLFVIKVGLWKWWFVQLKGKAVWTWDAETWVILPKLELFVKKYGLG